MPSNQTPNYALNQWERDDRILMEDFNADNAKIDRYNAILKELAAEKGVLYLNVAEEFKDADGCLPNSASPKDGIHFGSSWYRTWFDYLRTHGA